MGNEGLRDEWRKLIPTKDFLNKESSSDGIEKKAQRSGGSEGVGTLGSVVSGTGGIGQAVFMRPLDYRPEFASPDRWLLPRDFGTRAKYWRMFYEFDPVVGSVIDIYSEMMWSDFDVVNVEDDGIKEEVEVMLHDLLKLQTLMRNVAVEFLIVGEAIVHLFYDQTKGLWSGAVFHRAEDVEVIDLNMVAVEPVLVLKMSEDDLKNLRKLKKVYDRLGEVYGKEEFGSLFWLNSDYVEEALRNRKVMLEPLNVGYVPRKLHMYSERGVSLLTRLWRVFMFEDALFSASITTAKRHAAPVKVVTMGDLGSGYIPTDEQVKSLLSVLAQAETDVQSWVFVPPGTRFEAWGTTERLMGISKEYEIIERLKLTALGVSKDFITGASTFASAQASLQVFLSRLLSFRNMLEENFIYPKILRPIVKVRKWRVPTKAEVEHKIVKKITDEVDYVKPEIRWKKTLKPSVDRELLDAYRDLVRDFEMKLSARTVAEAVGLSWDQELRKRIEEEESGKFMGVEKEKQEGMFGGGFGMPPVETAPIGEGGVEGLIGEPTVEMGGGEGVRMHAGGVMRKDDKFLSGENYYKRGFLIDKINNGDIIEERIKRGTVKMNKMKKGS